MAQFDAEDLAHLSREITALDESIRRNAHNNDIAEEQRLFNEQLATVLTRVQRILTALAG
jgi:hypothetical protein